MVTFQKEQVTPHISRIRSTPDVCMYLVEGSRRAALIDTGDGVGDLRGYVEGLLQGKPYDVIITHGHVDHASGAEQFDCPYMSELDYELSLSHCSVEHRKKIFAHMREKFPGTIPEFAEEDFVKVRTRPYAPLKDGQQFDLGGITLRMIHTPGHTRGMMVVLDVEERVAFFGDACGVGVLMIAKEATSIARYRKSLLNLKTFEAQYGRVLRQHGLCESPKSVLDDNIEVCEKILTGTDDAVADKFEGMPCIRAMKVDPKTQRRMDGKEGNILYVPEKLHD